MIRRMQVKNRRFGYVVGCTYVGVKEYRRRGQSHKLISFGFGTDCVCGHEDRKKIRELILRRLESER